MFNISITNVRRCLFDSMPIVSYRMGHITFAES